MVRLLIKHGVTIDCRSQHARTPLHWATIKGHDEIVSILLAHGADRYARDTTGRTPCDWAIDHKNTKITTLFQERITQ
jgi:ankyrin repeat protein